MVSRPRLQNDVPTLAALIQQLDGGSEGRRTQVHVALRRDEIPRRGYDVGVLDEPGEGARSERHGTADLARPDPAARLSGETRGPSGARPVQT